jgi:diguanylate cyclase (GGDEF)-like protein/PAS domain S-box-containing protein
MGSEGVAAAGPPAGRDGEARFLRALVEHSADMVSAVAADGSLLYHYPPGVLGYDEGENFGTAIFDFIHPDDRDLAVRRFAEALETPGAAEPFECRIRAADDSWRWIEVTGNNLFDDPEVGALMLNTRDVTDRKVAEDALRHSEERFRSLIKHSSDIIGIMDEAGAIVFVSPAISRIIGVPVEELIGTSAFDLLHPEDVEAAVTALVNLIEDPTVPQRVELRAKHRDGTYRDLEVVPSNLLDDPSVRGIVLNSRDITDRRRAEQSERDSHEWFRSLVQHGSDIIAVVDPDTTVRYVSPSVEHIMGYPHDDFVGHVGFDFVHPDDVEAVATHFGIAVATAGYHGAIELRALHADGTWRWLEATHTNRLDDPAVHGMVLNFRDVTERKVAEEQLAHQALHDSLTGLPNRTLLTDRLEQALTRGARDATCLGVVFLDLDRFKLVNDTRGHVAGDALLNAVARRLRSAIRASDTVARFGGDEFVVIYEEVGSVEEVVELGEQLCETLSAPFQVEGAELYVTISVGAAVSCHGGSAETLLRDADAAMYHAKERGGATVVAFDDSIRQRANTRFETERALRTALERDELNVVYQPLVDLESGRIVSMEALLRWDHPQRGTILPSDFIALAEETGLIVPIGARALMQSCLQLAEWRELPGASDLEVSVNVSAVQLRDPQLLAHVAAALDHSGLAAKALTLEITESLLIEDTVACLDSLEGLKDLGVRLTVDDFGTRYSSLGYLNRMPLDGLKIDRTFVHRLGGHPRDTAIVSAIVAMADALGLSVVAEGVETAAQRAQLLNLGCHLGQGFLFAVPGRVDVATRLVRSGEVPTGPDVRTTAPVA